MIGKEDLILFKNSKQREEVEKQNRSQQLRVEN